MIAASCSFLGLASDDEVLSLDDYASSVARWCPGCGDHAVLTAVRKLLEAEQLPRERTVFVSGIGCSSRFPHYVKTYGFHGLHGRALPVALGVKLRRPDLKVFVVMGDGDCCSIGAGHWVHTTRYNPEMVALMLDNAVYGLTKNQTSPTSPKGVVSNTQPRGAILAALNPLSVALGIGGVSFVAQSADWLPAHLFATLTAAYRHKGFAFVRVLQRCPEYTEHLYTELVKRPEKVTLLTHEKGILLPELDPIYKNQLRHDPTDLHAARRLADDGGTVRLGIFYQNSELPSYDELRFVPPLTAGEKFDLLNRELDRYAV